MWGMINALQLIRYSTKFNMLIPGNVYLFFYNMDAFLSMKAEFVTDLADKAQRTVLRINGSNKALQNLGTYIFAGVGLALAMIFTWVLKSLRERFQVMKTVTDVLMRKLFFNSVLRYAMQSYVKYCETSFEAFNDIGFGSAEKSINLPIALLALVFIFGYPTFTYFFMKTNVQKMKHDTEFVARYNSLFFTLNVERPYALVQTTMFLVRRLLLVTAVFYLKSSPYLQFLSMYFLTMPFVFLLVIHPPLLTPVMNRLELYNEVVILACTCLLIGFTDIPSTTETRNNIGWVFIGLASTIIAATAGVIVHQVATFIYGKWRAWQANNAKMYAEAEAV
jgi:hypothetical protein